MLLLLRATAATASKELDTIEKTGSDDTDGDDDNDNENDNATMVAIPTATKIMKSPTTTTRRLKRRR